MSCVSDDSDFSQKEPIPNGENGFYLGMTKSEIINKEIILIDVTAEYEKLNFNERGHNVYQIVDFSDDIQLVYLFFRKDNGKLDQIQFKFRNMGRKEFYRLISSYEKKYGPYIYDQGSSFRSYTWLHDKVRLHLTYDPFNRRGRYKTYATI